MRHNTQKSVITVIDASNIPLWISKDGLAQLEIAKYNTTFVTVAYGAGYLLEQVTRLRLLHSPLASHVRVQVAIVTLEHEIRLGTAQYDLLYTADVFVVTHGPVGLHHVAVLLHGNHLATQHSH